MSENHTPQTRSLCSADWVRSGLPVWGSAKFARTIVVIEHAGAWGAHAVDDAGFAAPPDAVLYLIRRPGRHAETPKEPMVYISGGFSDQPWLVGGRLREDGIHELLRHDVTDADVWRRFMLAPVAHSLLLICTNGSRDLCCAVVGRPVVEAAYEAAPEAVWEVSHIGGHRFAPTGIHLPSGQTFGAMTPDDAIALAQATPMQPLDLFTPHKHRGRVDLSPREAVAETWWRIQAGVYSLFPPVSLQRDDADSSQVVLPDGSHVQVHVEAGPALRDSCAKAAKPSQHFSVTAPNLRG